jgi:SAM-dependent methyltransferase
MSKRIFWDRFYTKHNEDAFEWLVDYSELISNINEKFLVEYIGNKEKPSIRLLDAGCGTSMFGFNLSRSINLPVSLVCADFSREALNILRNKHNYELLETRKRNTSNSPFQSSSITIDYIECNCKYLPFKHDSFDIIVDKGYLDSVLKATNSTQSIKSSLRAICNLLENLNINGYLLQITDETPDLRMSLFDQLKHNDFKLGYFFKEIDLDNDRVYYAYFLRKIKY